MKWSASVTLIRHDTSAYNVLSAKKKKNPLYKRFLDAFEKNPNSKTTQALARQVQKVFALGVGDAETPLADKEGKQAYKTGLALSKAGFASPDAVFVSPYARAKETFFHLVRGWKITTDSKHVIDDERVREQEHGLALLYNDWRVFEALHPEQRQLRALEGSYWYRYPQGESIPDVRLRNRQWLSTLTRDYAGKHVFVVTHHLNILAMRANLERLDAAEFLRLDEEEKPINCGVTRYVGNPSKGKDGKLELEFYNRKYY